MTGQEIKELYEFLVDDSNVSVDNFLTMTRNEIQKLAINPQQFEIFQTNDDSQTTTSGVPYISLPTDFLQPIDLWIGDQNIKGIARRNRRLFRNSSYRYYIDWKNSRFVLTNNPTNSQIVYIDYIYQPNNVELDVDLETTIPGFKKAFHPLLAYNMAETFFYQDTGSKVDSWDREHKTKKEEIMKMFIEWDQMLKITAQNSAIIDVSAPTNNPNVIDE